jgi:hypothetical protein
MPFTTCTLSLARLCLRTQPNERTTRDEPEDSLRPQAAATALVVCDQRRALTKRAHVNHRRLLSSGHFPKNAEALSEFESKTGRKSWELKKSKNNGRFLSLFAPHLILTCVSVSPRGTTRFFGYRTLFAAQLASCTDQMLRSDAALSRLSVSPPPAGASGIVGIVTTLPGARSPDSSSLTKGRYGTMRSASGRGEGA